MNRRAIRTLRRRAACAAFVVSATATALAVGLGCTGGSETASLNLDEPIQVENATFHPGDLPGIPPSDAGADAVDPQVTTINTPTAILRPGVAKMPFNGGATDTADSLGVRLADAGTGYWTLPLGGPDPTKPGELTWSMNLDVSANAPEGLGDLLFVAIDDGGVGGTQSDLPICVDTPFADNLNACDPTIPPPQAVLSLTWDTNADLDLVVLTPDGRIVDPKHPTTATSTDGGVAPNPAVDGYFDRDSNGACVIDGLCREDLIWQAKPLAGQYYVYVDMFAACGEPAARFTVTLYLPAPEGDGGQTLVAELVQSGVLLSTDQDDGATDGLFVTQFQIQ